MKRSLLFFVLITLFIGGTSYAADHLNIYASGLRLHGATPAEQVTGENKVHIDYFLNAPANDLKFLVLDASTGDSLTSVTIPAGTSNANYTKGSHSDVVVDLSGFYGNDQTYNWALKATGAANTSSSSVTSPTRAFTIARGIASDMHPESETFGNLYVTDPVGTVSANAGIWMYNAGIEDYTNQGNTPYLNNHFSAKVASPYRPFVGEDGLVYISDWCDLNPDITIFDPQHPTNAGKKVFDETSDSDGIVKTSGGDQIHGSMSSCFVTGIGSSRKLYTVDEDITALTTANKNIYRYDIGNLTSKWSASPSAIVYDNAVNKLIGNANDKIYPSNHGGIWVSQHRATDDDYPVIFYINSSGLIGYNTNKSFETVYSRAGFAVNADETLLAAVAQTNIKIYNISWSNGNPSLSLKETISAGLTNNGCYDLSFDYADNVYALKDGAKVIIYALGKSSNTCTTPAASSRTIVLRSYIPPTLVTGVSLDQDSKTLVKGQSFTLTATVAPSNATNKNVTWTSTDPTVASVSNVGEVTALKKGTTTIRVTTEDGSFTDECAVTVELMHGTYNIGGASANYTSLSAAATAIRNIGIDGDVVLLVCADIAENANIGLVNNTDYSITIRPNAATKRTITFGSQADNAGPSGHIMIGYNLTGWAATTTKNIIIDGSYNDEGQFLEFRAGTNGGVVACFYGNATNSVIKNCRLINPRTSGSENSGVQIRVEQLAGGSRAKSNLDTSNMTNNSPENVGVENCYIEAVGTTSALGVYFNAANALTVATGGPKDCYVRNCEIHARQRGIHLQGVVNADISGNTICIPNGPSGLLSSGVCGTNTNGTISVKNNKLIELVTKNTYANAYGIQGIIASGGADSWIIENNYFAGMDIQAAAVTDKDFVLTYVRCGDSCVVRHNTFYMPSLSNKPATALTSANPITCLNLASTKKHHVKNNIFVSAETGANNSLIRGALNSNISSNIYYHNGGNCAIVAGAATYTTWDDFDDVADAGSKWAAPVFSNAADGDLGIVEANADLMVARLNDVLKDMFGNDRNNPTYAGACEPVAVTAITGVPATLTLEEIGDTHTFTATVVPANTTFPTITWSSNNESVATVSAAGVVTAQSAGTATVTATAGGFSVNCLVTVNAAHSLSGTYRIGGANADFASLHAACEQIDTYGLKGDATLLICADLTESQNSGLVNPTDYTLTIRPDADVDRTISFTQVPDNAGPTGPFIIGCDMSLTHVDKPTNNIIIDGYPEGGSTRRLTLMIAEGFGASWGPIIFYGQTEGCIVRNAKLINAVSSGSNCYAIMFRPYNANNHTPHGVIIENNYIENKTHNAGQAIYFTANSNTNSYPTGTIIRNNEIVASTRGMFINKAGSTIIEGNTFRIEQKSASILSHCIMGNAATGIITVRNNKFIDIPSINTAEGDFGMQAITASGGATAWVIENNYFAGLDATGAVSEKAIKLCYVRCGDSCVVRHNTFYMPSLTNKPATPLASANPISCLYLAGSKKHRVENNIFLSEETAAHNSLISGTLNDNILSNVFYHNGGNAALTSGESTMDNLDASNKWMSIAFTETYKLDFESANNSLIAVTPISGITTDIEGRTRTNPTHAGCYEPSWGLILNEEAANSDAIDAKDGQTMDVLLKRHFLVDDGLYTLVLPFDLDNEQLEEAFGVGYKLSVMQTAYFKTKTSDALYLKFGFVDHLDAGVPCLLRVGNDVTEDILFRDVTIDNAEPIIAFEDVVEMRGLYDMTNVPAAVTNYYLGTDDYLFQYKTTIATKGFRSYFYFPGFATSAPPRVARVIFREDVATDDLMIEDAPATAAPEKIIRDGEMLIIVDGVEYDMMGRPRVR